MRRVQCHECRKRYDFDVNDFCPRCGAFTQPARSSRIGMDGSVIRTEGINEKNHKNSFVHSEYHGENQKRKGSALDRTAQVEKLRSASKKVYRNVGGRLGGNTSHSGADVLSGVFDIVSDLLDT